MKISLLSILLVFSTLVFSKDYLEDYNVVWNSQSKNCFESMPLGGGDVGLNVWVENDELLFYVAQSGTFDENNQMLKHGRVRMSLSPNPFKNAEVFQQQLKLREGGIEIIAKNDINEVKINLWVDVFSPVVHITTECQKPTITKASYETWRMADLVVPPDMRHGSFSLTGYPGEVVTYKDSIAYTDNGVRWIHRNRSDKLLYDMIVKQQDLLSVKDKIPNTQINRTFGGQLMGEGMKSAGLSEGKYVSTDFTGWQLESEKPTNVQTLQVILCAGQYPTLENWEHSLDENITSQNETKASLKETHLWWDEFWNRSHIITNEDATPSDSVWQAGRNYQLFRYMLGCNAMGEYPTKFNGSLFTVDPVFTKEKYDWTPDFRCWGGGSFTAQNQRLVYWPMLKTGDFKMMTPQFDYYERILTAAEARTARYWGHEGACFTEQLENFGLPFAGGWGFETGGRERSAETEYGVQTNPHVNYHYVNQLEFSMMILEYYRFTGNDISAYLPFIKSSIKFFDEHYQYRKRKRDGAALDENGKLVFYPSTAAEMYKFAENPTDVISALLAVLPMLQALPLECVSETEKEYYKAYLNRVPAIPFDNKEGHKVIKPAASWKYVANQEMPELYAIFPYSIYGKHKADLDVAINTWNYGESIDKKKFMVCWSQVGIFAARMGLAEEAGHYMLHKMEDAANRFPAFWGPGPDWIPDVDHGGSGMINLQEMLMQTTDEKIYLFPAWPKDWDVKFKLHAPQNTIVDVELKNGEIKHLEVTPKSRAKDVVIDL